jgi:Tfp pilus assembly protein PilV
MAGSKMRGFALIEVLISLFIIMVFFVGISKISVISTRSCTYSENLTYASVLGHSKLLALQQLPLDSSELSSDWHQDPENPITSNNRNYYRFWMVSAVSLGKEIRMFVAWDDTQREKAFNFGSLESLQGSTCPWVDFSDVFLQE